MAKKPKPNPYLSEADALALVRFGPETTALKALMQQAAEDRDTAIKSAASTSSLVRSAVDEARPTVRSAYDQSMRQAAAQQAIAAPQLTPGSPFAQAAAIEQTGLNSRLAESRAAEDTALTNRRIAAGEGAAYAQTAANRQYAQDRSKIGQRALDLANEQGAFTASTAMDLQSADDKLASQENQAKARLSQQERASIRKAGLDPDQPLKGGGYAPIPGGKLDPKAKPAPAPAKTKWATSQQQAAAADSIQEALQFAQKLKAHNVTRQDAAAALQTGQDAQPVYDPKTGKRVLNPDGTQATTPAVPKVKSQLLLSVALDAAYDNHISRRNEKLLHQRGIKIGPLGVQTFQQWLQTPEGQAWLRRGGRPAPADPRQAASAIPGAGRAVR